MSLAKKYAFRLIAVLIPIVMVLCLEFALWLIKPDFSSLEGNANPSGLPYFSITKENGYQIFRPSEHYRTYNHDFELSLPKPKSSFRIFSLGGSSVRGHPFFNPGAFSAWLDQMLVSVSYGASYEVVNSGQGSFPLSEVMYLEREILKSEPDLLIIYSGNNEFFYKRDRLGKITPPRFLLRYKDLLGKIQVLRLLRFGLSQIGPSAPAYEIEPDSMQQHAAFFLNNGLEDNWDRDNRDQVLAKYKATLESMLSMAHDRGARVILCTIAVNMRDWEPYGSFHRPGLNEARLTEYERLVSTAKHAFASADFTGALDGFNAAAELDDTPAELQFYLGHTLLQMGRTDQAYRHFQAAVDRDPFRDRAGSDINAIIRELALQYDVTLLDTAELFRQASQDGIPGDDLFVDFVHPTLEGQQLIAREILKIMIDKKWVTALPSHELKTDAAIKSYSAKMPSDYLFSSYYTAASMNAFMGRFSHARIWLTKALEHEPANQDGLWLKHCLDQILKQRGADDALPWGEVEFAGDFQIAK